MYIYISEHDDDVRCAVRYECAVRGCAMCGRAEGRGHTTGTIHPLTAYLRDVIDEREVDHLTTSEVAKSNCEACAAFARW